MLGVNDTKISSVQSLSHVQLFVTPWTAKCQASLFITNTLSLLKLVFIELVMPSNHPVLCFPLLLPPSIISSIRVFSNVIVRHIRWPKYWSLSFNISPSNEYSGLISFRMAPELEKVSFHPYPKERKCQRMFKLPHNFTHSTH